MKWHRMMIFLSAVATLAACSDDSCGRVRLERVYLGNTPTSYIWHEEELSRIQQLYAADYHFKWLDGKIVSYTRVISPGETYESRSTTQLTYSGTRLTSARTTNDKTNTYVDYWFYYDNSGQLKQRVSWDSDPLYGQFYDTMSYTWQNGNVVQTRLSSNGFTVGYTYDGKKNPYRTLPWESLLLVLEPDKLGQNNCTSYENNGSIELEYTYEYDDCTGYPTRGTSSSGSSYLFEYEPL